MGVYTYDIYLYGCIYKQHISVYTYNIYLYGCIYIQNIPVWMYIHTKKYLYGCIYIPKGALDSNVDR